MSNINSSLVSDEELAKKLKVKLNKMGIDFHTFVQKFVEGDFDESVETPKKQEKSLISFSDLSEEERERRIKIAKTKGPRSEAYGIFTGMIWMAEDFDEPLECMKEYME